MTYEEDNFGTGVLILRQLCETLRVGSSCGRMCCNALLVSTVEALALKHPLASSFENVPQRLEPLRHGLFQALRAVHLLFRTTVEGH
jgi:hypothetical protein